MEEFWIFNPIILIKNYKNIYPKKITNNIFNCLTRILLYASIFFLFINKKLVYICILCIIIINLIGYIYIKEYIKNDKKEQIKVFNSCRRSSINNPMMNVVLLDENPEIEACPVENKNDDNIKNNTQYESKKKIDYNLNYNLLQDETDINVSTKLRNFITLGNTKYTNDINKFLNFLNLGNKK